MIKNVAGQRVAFRVTVTSTGAPQAGMTNITGKISKDGGAGANLTAPVEVDATDLPGVYEFTLTQSESNADMIVIQPATVTADRSFFPATAIIYTDRSLAAYVTDDDTLLTEMQNSILPVVREE